MQSENAPWNFSDLQMRRQHLPPRYAPLFSLRIISWQSLIAIQISNIKSRTFTVPDSIATTADGQPATTDRVGRVKLTPEERKRVEQLIRDAKSLADITRLEKELNEGRVPGGVVG